MCWAFHFNNNDNIAIQQTIRVQSCHVQYASKKMCLGPETHVTLSYLPIPLSLSHTHTYTHTLKLVFNKMINGEKCRDKNFE